MTFLLCYYKPKSLIEDLSHNYCMQTHNLIKPIDKKFNFSSTPVDKITLPQPQKIYDSFNTIAWYHSLIHVKIKRASHSKKEYLKYKNKDMKEISKYDMDGTAKVAALSISNSIKALSDLHEYLPGFGVEILKLSLLLKNIFTELEKEFPDYNKFIRPGFDD